MKPGLTVVEWERIRERDLTYLKDAVTAVTPYAGLTSNALAHLRDEWISWRDSHVRIDIPAEAPCNSFKSRSVGDAASSDALPQIVDRDQSCKYCRNTGHTDGFENQWGGPETSSTQAYSTVLHRELAAPAVDFLGRVFHDFDRPELAVQPSSVHGAARSVVPSESYSYSKLLRTGPVIYCHYGLTPDKITSITPYTEATIKEIISVTSSVSISRQSTLAFLRVLNKEGPMTVKQLADEVDSTWGTVHPRLHRLKEKGKVKVSNNDTGPPAATWHTTPDWRSAFQCRDCNFMTHSLQGISSHETQSH